MPNQALRFRPPGATANDGATVWLLDAHDRPVPVAVALGLTDDRSTEIRSGQVAAGQPVVIGIPEPAADRLRRPIENNSSPGQAVYEPFCGSGTTIIARANTWRSSRASHTPIG